MPLQLVTNPAAEPIALAAAKTHLRVTDTADDTLIPGLIAAARQAAESTVQRQFVAARWKFNLDAFPGPTLIGIPPGRPYTLPAHAIWLPLAPVIQVVSIQYLDMAGVQQTLAPTDYAVDLSSEPVRITPVFGKIWPVTLPQIAAVSITFDAGYATPIAVDATANTIAPALWKTLAVNDLVRVSNSGGALPAGLSAKTNYYVQSVVSPGVYTLSATAGGAAIDITDTGSGSNFLGEIPEGLMSWMALRVGSLYENREEVALLQRGVIHDLPFVDGLLDPYRLTVY